MEKLIHQAQKLHAIGKLAEAEDAYRELITTLGDDPRVLQPLGQICYQRGKHEDSISFLQRLCEVAGDNAMNHFSTASVCKEAGRVQEAISHFQQALSLEPDFVNAHVNLSAIYYEQMSYSNAIASCERALSIAPDDIKALYNLGLSLVPIGKVEQAVEAMKRVLLLNPDLHKVRSTYLFILHYIADITSERLYEAHMEWAALHAELISPEKQLTSTIAKRERPMRVGYVSPDLRRHSVAYFMTSILEGHDRSVIESYCYSDTINKDDMSKRLQGLSDVWHDSGSWSDERLVQQIRSDEIDILIDLAGHSYNNRLLVFARKPAPVQVSYLGYPDITGLTSIDYRLTDSWADPVDDQRHSHGEELIRLPDGFLCFEPLDIAPDVSDLPALKTGAVTFGSFNNMPKINSGVITAWAEILKAIPEARLLLKTKGLCDVSGRDVIYKEFENNGIDAERIECIGYVSDTRAHLDLYSRIDIALDTFPYTGTTTTCEAFWMGVPVITLAGDWHAARVGVSLLTAVGLDDYIATSMQEYINIAVKKAADLASLKGLRRELRTTIMKSRLMDKERFVRGLEDAFRDISKRHRN